MKIYIDNIDKHQLNLDLKNAFILSYMGIKKRKSLHVFREDGIYFTCFAGDILRDCPLLGINSKEGIRSRLAQLKNDGYLKHYIRDNNTPYYSLTDKSEIYLSDDT